jgi:hypothetical protein
MEIGSGVRIGPFEVFAPLQPAVSLVRHYGEHHFRGRLIVVEGIDGSGKSTQLSLRTNGWNQKATAWFSANGIPRHW